MPSKLTSPHDESLHLPVTPLFRSLIPLREVLIPDSRVFVPSHQIPNRPPIDIFPEKLVPAVDAIKDERSSGLLARRGEDTSLVLGEVEGFGRGEESRSDDHSRGEGEDGEEVLPCCEAAGGEEERRRGELGEVAVKEGEEGEEGKAGGEGIPVPSCFRPYTQRGVLEINKNLWNAEPKGTAAHPVLPTHRCPSRRPRSRTAPFQLGS